MFVCASMYTLVCKCMQMLVCVWVGVHHVHGEVGVRAPHGGPARLVPRAPR